jgi:hypothetical protein
MEPLLVPRLPDPIACLDETKAANREFTSFAGVLSIRDSPCRHVCFDRHVSSARIRHLGHTTVALSPRYVADQSSEVGSRAHVSLPLEDPVDSMATPHHNAALLKKHNDRHSLRVCCVGFVVVLVLMPLDRATFLICNLVRSLELRCSVFSDLSLSALIVTLGEQTALHFFLTRRQLNNMSVEVKNSLRPISEQSWIIGEKLLLWREIGTSPGNIPSGNNDFSYAFREVDDPPETEQPGANIPFTLVYDAGDTHAVWKIGDSFLKVIVPSSPYTTREHIALGIVRDMSSTMSIPEVLFHGEWGGRYYLIVTEMQGQTLDRLWPKINERRRRECIDRIVFFCKELCAQKADNIGGIDGNHLPDAFLINSSDDTDRRFCHDRLLRNCRDLGMDCSKFVLSHCDLGPGNILLDVDTDSMSVIDFECVGYVPIEWIRTKFRICSGLDLTCYDFEDEAKTDWRSGVQRSLGKEGFPDVAERWMNWRYAEET